MNLGLLYLFLIRFNTYLVKAGVNKLCIPNFTTHLSANINNLWIINAIVRAPIICNIYIL